MNATAVKGVVRNGLAHVLAWFGLRCVSSSASHPNTSVERAGRLDLLYLSGLLASFERR